MSIILAIVLWWVIRAVSLSVVINGIQKFNIKEGLHILIGFLKKRAERKLFIAFMATEAGLAGVLPQIMKIHASVTTSDTEAGLWLELCQNSEWFSFAIAVLIAFGYYLYIWLSHRNNPEDWRTVIESCRLIDSEYNFIPTLKWFEDQNTKQIKNLDKRFSEERNFPFENMEFALASLEISDCYWPLLKKDIKNFKDTLCSFVAQFSKDNTCAEIVEKSKLVIDEIVSLDGSTAAYIKLLESTRDFVARFDTFYYDSENYKRQDIQNSRYSIHDKSSRLESSLSNEWIAFKDHHTIIITGEAGTGKSHLMGDLVTQRKRAQKPSILLLGQHFTNASDPLSQIKELLDIKCKKERLLSQLNYYGKRIGQPVVIFIDALNENAGEDLWRNFLTNLINEIESLEYLSLIVSFRI